MSSLRNIFAKLRNKLDGCTFNSDYRVEKDIIENVYRAYVNKISAGAEHRYLWRSVCQYRCQSFARKKMMVLMANIGALLCIPAFVFLVRPSRKPDAGKLSCKYLKINFHMAYQVPGIIRDITKEKTISGKYLTSKDLAFAVRLFVENRAFYPELLFKFLLWIVSVRPYLDSCTTEYLIQYCEYSSYSSLRKLFLNRQGILIANVSHGEEIVSCRSAFSSFDQYFAWDITPRFVHDAMHIEYIDRFCFNPCAGLGPAAASPTTPTLGFLWPSIAGPDLVFLVAQLNRISEFSSVIVRPHPNSKCANHFGSYRHTLRAQVSDPHKEDIHCFIDRCSILAGNQSAALLQAAFRGRDVIYLNDAYLASVREYHEYYQKVECVDIEGLGDALSVKFNQNRGKQ
jgi:hypothetical protein